MVGYFFNRGFNGGAAMKGIGCTAIDVTVDPIVSSLKSYSIFSLSNR